MIKTERNWKDNYRINGSNNNKLLTWCLLACLLAGIKFDTTAKETIGQGYVFQQIDSLQWLVNLPKVIFGLENAMSIGLLWLNIKSAALLSSDPKYTGKCLRHLHLMLFPFRWMHYTRCSNMRMTISHFCTQALTHIYGTRDLISWFGIKSREKEKEEWNVLDTRLVRASSCLHIIVVTLIAYIDNNTGDAVVTVLSYLPQQLQVFSMKLSQINVQQWF